MKRKDKYPDTNTFRYYNANPKNRLGDDCVIRAISTALEQTWEITVRELTEIGIKHGYVLNDKNTYNKYLKAKGWVKHNQPKRLDGTKYTGAEFCRYLNKKGIKGNIVTNIGGHHIVAIIPIDGKYKVNDIWDSTYKCIGNFWIKE